MKRFYREIRIYIILFATIVMLSACSKLIKGQGYLVTAPGGYSQVFRDLDATAAADLSEQAFLKADKMASPITIAQYFPAKNVVMAIYGNDGFLRTWNIEESKVLSEFDLGITGDIYAGFGDNGNLIMGAMRSIVQENDYGELAERVGGIGIWKSSSGDLLTCIVYPCERTAPLEEWQRHLISGAAFDPDGRWVISNYDTLISITDITDHEIPYSISFSDTDVNHREIALATIDSFNDRFAVAFIDGEILIQSLGKKNLSFLFVSLEIGNAERRFTI